MTCIEPESSGHVITGLPFHKWYFDCATLSAGNPLNPTVDRVSPRTTLKDLHIKLLGDVAVVSYSRCCALNFFWLGDIFFLLGDVAVVSYSRCRALNFFWLGDIFFFAG